MLNTLMRHKTAGVGFIIICAIGFAAWRLNGAIYRDAVLVELYEALRSSGLYLGSAIATSSATTLALMLTMLGLVRQIDKDFDRGVYQSVVFIGVMSATCLVSAILLLLLFTLPVSEYDQVPSWWYSALYNLAYGLIVLVSALAVTIVLILTQIIVSVIRNITPTSKS
ncbi:MAG: hypothetical protein ACSHX3_07925 [Litorimonas sp.]